MKEYPLGSYFIGLTLFFFTSCLNAHKKKTTTKKKKKRIVYFDNGVRSIIFSYCSVPTLRTTCVYVCRCWRVGVALRLSTGIHARLDATRDVYALLRFTEGYRFHFLGLTATVEVLHLLIQKAPVSFSTLRHLHVIDRFLESEEKEFDILSKVCRHAPHLSSIYCRVLDEVVANTLYTRGLSVPITSLDLVYFTLGHNDKTTRIGEQLRHLQVGGGKWPTRESTSWTHLEELTLYDVEVYMNSARASSFLHDMLSLQSLALKWCKFSNDYTDCNSNVWTPPTTLRSLILCQWTELGNAVCLRVDLRYGKVPLRYLYARVCDIVDVCLPSTLTDLTLAMDVSKSVVFGTLPCLLRLRLEEMYSYPRDKCNGTCTSCDKPHSDYRELVASPLLRECHIGLTHRSSQGDVVTALLGRSALQCVVTMSCWGFGFPSTDGPLPPRIERTTREEDTTSPGGGGGRWCYSLYERGEGRQTYVSWCDYVWPLDTDTPPTHIHRRVVGDDPKYIGSTRFMDVSTLPFLVTELMKAGYVVINSFATVQKLCPTNGVDCICTLTPSCSVLQTTR